MKLPDFYILGVGLVIFLIGFVFGKFRGPRARLSSDSGVPSAKASITSFIPLVVLTIFAIQILNTGSFERYLVLISSAYVMLSIGVIIVDRLLTQGGRTPLLRGYAGAAGLINVVIISANLFFNLPSNLAGAVFVVSTAIIGFSIAFLILRWVKPLQNASANHD